MEQLKKLIEKWKAEARGIENKIIQSDSIDKRIVYRGDYSRLKSCISEAEQLLQETGEGREENH